MSEDNIDMNESLTSRTKEEIKLQLDEVEKQYDQLYERFQPVDERLEQLSKDTIARIKEFVKRFEEKDLEDSEINESFPKNIRPIVYDIMHFVKEARKLENRRAELQNEYTPHRRKDFEKALTSLASRVNYDAVFDYYREIDQGTRERVDADSLNNTATELYMLRLYQYEQSTDKSTVEDFHYFDRGVRELQYFERQWNKKGFLREKPDPAYKPPELFGDEVTEMRNQVAKKVGIAVEQLDEYSRLVRIYRPSLIFNREHIDYSLKSVQRLLETGEAYLYSAENFDKVDFDPAFIEAAERHAKRLIASHARAGRLPKTTEILHEDRQRIDAINSEGIFEGLVFEGFDTPEGMKRAVEPQDILIEARKLIPPDFAANLRKISHKPIPEKDPDEDPDTETVGRFIPIFEAGKHCDQMRATEIEVYIDLCVPEDMGEIETRLVKSNFMGTLWHELGHNVQYTLDYDEMKGWEKIVHQDNTAVTWYVKYSREMEEDRGKREDFAESFRLYLTHPALLYILSPPRFTYMQKYFDRHLQTEQRQAFNRHIIDLLSIENTVWKKNDYSDSDIREIYLSHERRNEE